MPSLYNLNWPIPAYADFVPSAPVIPKLYWDVYSQEQRIEAICEAIEKISQYDDTTTEGINENHDAIAALQAQFQQFQESGFNDYYETQVKEWLADNLDYVFTEVVQQIYFGLNLQGYFVAYIPRSWNEIVFDTGAVYTEDTYGRLILRWQVPATSTETVDQTPEIVRM